MDYWGMEWNIKTCIAISSQNSHIWEFINLVSYEVSQLANDPQKFISTFAEST